MLGLALLFKDDVVLKLMRDNFLRDLVANKAYSQQNIRETLTQLKLNPYFMYPAAALIEPSKELKKREQAALIRECIEQQAPKGSVVFVDEAGRVCLLFSWISKETIESVRTMLNVRFSNNFNIGVGKPCKWLSDIHSSYAEASEALQNKFYKGAGQTIYYSEIVPYAQPEDYPDPKEQELFERVKSNAPSSEIDRAVNDFYAYILRNGPVPIKNVYELTIRLMVGMERRVFAEVERANGCKNKSYELTAVFHMETLKELKQYVSCYLEDLGHILSKTVRDGHRSVIIKTIQYMEQEYHKATLYSVAQKVYMTPTYLSLLFKANTGKTFIEQLTDIRIDKAKEMLRSTHMKNYEVAERVGYQDSRYFSQIFKKKVGISPSKYRESVGK
ncbi:helix-turn-helix domain-containing protein [Paenibacillus thermotolerans]|uniref:helix-turn-helix domain-containing protein n=1 Tax=Paenibacillus thermotolerans TaxID=3027807 RepID=UPI002368AC70|nr:MULTISPECIES: helix-turn-helix domain-containing protein [unclassified Paenibacillus]